jgi:hypothetical protein
MIHFKLIFASGLWGLDLGSLFAIYLIIHNYLLKSQSFLH